MKRFILIVFCFIAFLTYQSRANIAPIHCSKIGYSSTSITLTINGCDYTVWICFQCDYGVSTADTNKVYLNGFTNINDSCPQTWSTQQIKDYIVNYISNPAYLHSLCLQQGFPPCSQPPAEPTGLKYSVYTPMCWYKHTNLDETIDYIPCPSTNTCYYCYYICIYPINDVQVITTYDGPFQVYDGPPCMTSEEPPNPPIGTSSPCFSLPTLCNP
jgi:hypothetical protein